ncbi:MAG: energy-coupled thiamine transporter ThiT [Halanaerobiales bacterium]
MSKIKEYPVRLIAEIGVAIALATVLNFMPLWKMPQGGSISLEMLPILLIALRWGGKPGLLAGITYGLVQLIANPYIIHPVQLIMDYPLPYMMLGLAGFFNITKRNLPREINYFKVLMALLTAGLGRFIIHILSGVVFFASYAPEGQNVWIYSIVYNGSYILPSLILCYFLIILLLKKLVLREDMR